MKKVLETADGVAIFILTSLSLALLACLHLITRSIFSLEITIEEKE